MICTICSCEKDRLQREAAEQEWNAMTQAEKDAELLELQEQLRSVAADPNLIITSNSPTFCTCDCHLDLFRDQS